MRQATSVSRDTLLSLGTCFGKFTKSGKFRLHITCLDYISQYAKVWCTYNYDTNCTTVVLYEYDNRCICYTTKTLLWRL